MEPIRVIITIFQVVSLSLMAVEKVNAIKNRNVKKETEAKAKKQLKDFMPRNLIFTGLKKLILVSKNPNPNPNSDSQEKKLLKAIIKCLLQLLATRNSQIDFYTNSLQTSSAFEEEDYKEQLEKTKIDKLELLKQLASAKLRLAALDSK